MGGAAIPDHRRPPVVVQAGAQLEAVEPLDALLAAIDVLASAYAYWLTASDLTHRRDARELLGAAMDGVLAARNTYEGSRITT